MPETVIQEVSPAEENEAAAENEITVKNVIAAYKSRACRCEGKKKPKSYFCGECFFELPTAVQGKLYSKNFKTQVAGYQLGLEHFRGSAI